VRRRRGWAGFSPGSGGGMQKTMAIYGNLWQPMGFLASARGGFLGSRGLQPLFSWAARG